MKTVNVECKMCHARYKLPETTASSKVPCKRCGNTMFVTGRRTTTHGGRATMSMSGTPTRRRAGHAASYVLAAVAMAAIAGVLYWLA